MKVAAMKVAALAAQLVVAAAASRSRPGDVTITHRDVDRTAHWSTLVAPTGIESLDHDARTSTAFFATLLSAMRLPVPVADVSLRDYVTVEDPFETKGASVAALFTVLERPASADVPRMDLKYSFEHPLDALRTVHQMVSGFDKTSTSPAMADLIVGETVSVSGDSRYAYAAGRTVTPVEFIESDENADAVRDTAAFKAHPTVKDVFLLSELAAAIKAVKNVGVKQSFVNVVVTGLAAVDASSYAEAQALVHAVLTECGEILALRTEGAAFAAMVALVDERLDVERDVGQRIQDALDRSGHDTIVAYPHVYTQSDHVVSSLCDKIDGALSGTRYRAECGYARLPARSRRRADGSWEVKGLANPQISYVWQFQIFFWFTVLFVVVIVVVTTQIAGLDPGYDSVIYRMTPGGGR